MLSPVLMERLDPRQMKALGRLTGTDQVMNVHPPPHGGTVVTSAKDMTVLDEK